MKRERNKLLNESKGKRKKKDKITGTGINEKKGDTFNPQLSARELKKIQYYENMFKKMEKQKEENGNERENKNKKKSSHVRKTKKEDTANNKKEFDENKVVYEHIIKDAKNEDVHSSKEEYEILEMNEQKYQKLSRKKVNANDNTDEDFTPKNSTKKEYTIDENVRVCNSIDKKNTNDNILNNKELIIRIKKENLSKEKWKNYKINEGSKNGTNQNKNVINFSLFNSDSENETDKLGEVNKKYQDDEDNIFYSTIEGLNNYTAKSRSNDSDYDRNNNKIIEIIKGKKKFKCTNNNLLQINSEKGYVSDGKINYNSSQNEIRLKTNEKKYSGKEKKNVLKIKRSFSVNSNINEYFLDITPIILKSGYDSNSSENGVECNDNLNLYSFENKKKNVLNLLTGNVEGKEKLTYANKCIKSDIVKYKSCYYIYNTQIKKKTCDSAILSLKKFQNALQQEREGLQ
ncbi:conserved Plasmodium protein, unknown function [Plasmodium malariae]|uniref:Uncharacterized protein n=1 Tax=Plasmodium malariae TaxID=5858 RepID=A0A1C3L3P6_PLAMA|nr:conserved Plasmodium protein, unknown function [Plasmodium malariae]